MTLRIGSCPHVRESELLVVLSPNIKYWFGFNLSVDSEFGKKGAKFPGVPLWLL